MTILDGKATAAAIRAEAAVKVAAKKAAGQPCGLAVVLIGENPASVVYVRQKRKACEEAGIDFVLKELPATIAQDEALAVVHQLNADASITGILLQMPLPKESTIDVHVLQNAVVFEKDIDALSTLSAGGVLTGKPHFLPCTPYGVMEMLGRYNIAVEGKHVVVIGRSILVGKPVALLCQAANATVTMCHSRTVDLPSITKQADILIAAVGVPEMITGDYIKEGAVVIDVGINRTQREGMKDKLVGDCHYESCAAKASAITPVPGGVGPMTVAMLIKQLADA